jgi:cytochrome c-type biogenesis protein CcmE
VKTRRRYLIGGIVVAVAFGVLLFEAFGAFGSYSMTVSQFRDRQVSLGLSLSEFKAQQSSIGQTEVKLHAWVAGDTSSASSSKTSFSLTDGTSLLPVQYEGNLSAPLTPGTEVIIQGRQAITAFLADRVTTTKESRLEGPLSPDVNVAYDVNSRTTKFAITDPKNSAGTTNSFPVVYTGAVPDTFFVDVKTANVSMVVIGREGPNGVFLASQVLTKCASKYSASTPTASPSPSTAK